MYALERFDQAALLECARLGVEPGGGRDVEARRRARPVLPPHLATRLRHAHRIGARVAQLAHVAWPWVMQHELLHLAAQRRRLDADPLGRAPEEAGGEQQRVAPALAQ